MKIKKFFVLVLCLILCMQVFPVMTFAAETECSISGNGVKVTFDGEELTLYRLDGTTAIQMSNPSAMGYPVVNGAAVQDFTVTSCSTEQDITGVMGVGDRMVIISTSSSTGLIRTYSLETSNTESGVIYTETSYRASTTAVTPAWFVDSYFELSNHTDVIWSYNGGGEGPMHYYDTLQKISLTDSSTFTRENIQDYTAASIPVADIYSADGGITVGDASATRREVHTPVQETSTSASVSIKWPGKEIDVNKDVVVGQSFIVVHSGDYYCGLRGYKNAMEQLGVEMQTLSSDSQSYDLRWESWGWGFSWTIDLIIGKLDELQAAGVKQITLDDGWYTYAGDWELNSEKFPNGAEDARRLTDAIHEHGMTAILWWRPCDGGINSNLYQQHSEYFIKNADGSSARLCTPGGGASSSLGYALCPGSEGAIASQINFINRSMNDWGFDGYKGDFIWGMPKCYDSSHNHPYPEDSTERQSDFYRASYEAMVENNPDAFNLLCNCGTPQDYYSLPYVTQVATADPTSLDQTRTRVKAYKALMGDYYPVTTDHNRVWYDTTVGTGAVLIEKSAYVGTDQEKYERWLNIANTVQLHKGRFIGDLYVYGFDPYETYVVEKDGVMHYAFYRDGSKFTTVGYPEIELKGLDADKMYRIVDYVNDRVVATNLMGNEARFTNKFSTSLLVKAIKIEEPDDPSIVNPDWGFEIVDDRAPEVVYSGAWHDDSNAAFYNETARYSNATGASVEFTFTGTAIRWYGQKDTNFGTADVYLDDVLIETVNANGAAQTDVKLFEAVDLHPSVHTIRIMNVSGVIDVDRFAYQAAEPELAYTRVDDTSEDIVYSGTWNTIEDDMFYQGRAKQTNTLGDSAEFTFYGTAFRWYGPKYSSLSNADIYVDGEFVTSATLYGAVDQLYMIYEQTGLDVGEHTIRVVTTKNATGIDYFEYANEDADTGADSELRFTLVDDRDERLVFTGEWNDDSHNDFHSGTARYASGASATVELTFSGTAIQWYGQHDTNFGSATVYIDDELIETVNVNGNAAVGLLLFEKKDLSDDEHTLRIVCASPVIDVDYFAYGRAEQGF